MPLPGRRQICFRWHGPVRRWCWREPGASWKARSCSQSRRCDRRYSLWNLSFATDSLVVYYAGHGLVGPDGGLYLATRSTENLMDGLRYTALPYAALRESVIGSRARAVAVILDCCFSGRPAGPLGSMPLAPVFEQAAVRGGYLLAGTAREERGLAVPGATHTAFTGALIRLLIEGDQSFPELLTL